MLLRLPLSTAAAVTVLILSSAPLQATMQDTVSIGGTSLSLSATTIDFFSLGGPNAFDVGATSSGSYAALGGAIGTIQNLTSGSSPVSNFLTIPSLPHAQFTLTSIAPGIFSAAGCAATPPAVGQNCTPPGSPFNFINTPTGAVVSFSASGTVVNTSTGAQAPFSTTFSTEFTGQPFQSVLASLATAGAVSAPYSASINVPAGDFAGTLDVGQPSLTLSATMVSFGPSAVTIGPTSTGAFGTLSGTAATLQNVTIGSGSVSNFLTLAALPQADFTLTALNPGIFSAAGCAATPPAVDQNCTPPGSPFNFINTPTGALAFFSAEGTATDTNTLLQTPFEATFVTQFAGEFYQSLFETLASDGTVSASYSVEIGAGPFSPAVSVPEPATLALLGIGLAGLGFSRRKRTH